MIQPGGRYLRVVDPLLAPPHKSSNASAHHVGGGTGGSTVASVFDGPCTGGAASFAVAWRAITAYSVTLNTVRSCVTVTGPL